MITEKDIKEWTKYFFDGKKPKDNRRIFVFWGTEGQFGRFLKQK